MTVAWDAVVVTGTGRGLGAALAQELSSGALRVIALSRSAGPMAAHGQAIVGDLALDAEGIGQRLCAELEGLGARRVALVANAAVIEPIGLAGTLPPERLREAVATNLLSTMLLVDRLVRYVEQVDGQLLVVDVSSGAARRPVRGLAAYCATKAAVRMYLDVVAIESARVAVEHFDPGLIDTGMQAALRGAGPDRFPDNPAYVSAQSEGKLRVAQDVARELARRWFTP